MMFLIEDFNKVDNTKNKFFKVLLKQRNRRKKKGGGD